MTVLWCILKLQRGEKMGKTNYPQLDEDLDKKVIGFDGKTGTTMTNLVKKNSKNLRL